MTIKEIEELAEMSRANIRFYEAEGLLEPARNDNGYRDYSSEDLAVLKKIKLLRSLHMSLEEIKALHTGQQALSSVLEQQIRKLATDKEDLDKAQRVCEKMYEDWTDYASLDAEKYLRNLKQTINTSVRSEDVQPFSWESYWDTREAYEDTLPPVQAPWRRFFARTLDEAAYSVLWSCFLILVLDINIVNRSSGANILDVIMTMILTIVLEPLQLHLFGTTLGKWILGIRILHNDDRKLSYTEACERTGQVLFHGLGLHIPIYNIIRMWKSYKVCTERESLAWEYDSRMVLKDERSFRGVVYLVVRAALIGVILLANGLAQIPMHRGELTVAQFCDNYRQQEKYYGIETEYILGNDGKWQEKPQIPGTHMIYVFGKQDPPEFVFETDGDGKIQKISFKVEEYITKETPKDERPWLSGFQNQMQLAALSFVGAGEEFAQFSSARRDMIKTISEHAIEDYSFTEAGVTVTCEVKRDGFHLMGNELLIPEDEGECYFVMEFTMSR